MLGLTALGTLHTGISMVALLAGSGALLRNGVIRVEDRLGHIYVWATVLTCITGLGIFQHGGFGKPHALGLLTLATLGLAVWPAGSRVFGPRWRYVVIVSYTLTLFFHMIPGLTETFTRLPSSSPLFTGPDDAALQSALAVMFAIFLAGICWQIYRARQIHVRGIEQK
ncbi:MAG: hypothetical protein JWQ76_4011 [Ramlibacter sp.]|nr:hypothetical protein [Ramlibacter sp.]